MDRQRVRPFLLAGALSLLPLSLTAQLMPGSTELSFCAPCSECSWYCNAGTATALADGSFAVSTFGSASYQRRSVSYAQIEIVDASGAPQGGLGLHLSDDRSFYVGAPRVARGGSRGLVAAWESVSRTRIDILVKWSSAPRSRPRLASESRRWLCNREPQLASNGAGRVAIAWIEAVCGAPVTPSIGVRVFSRDRLPATPVLHLVPSRPAAHMEGPEVGIDATGRILVIWTEHTTQPQAVVLRGQRLDSDGQLLGPPFAIATGSTPIAYAILPDGEVAVVWRLEGPVPGGDIVWLQRHSGKGEPVGPPQVDLGLGPGALSLRIDSDSRNNLALVWQEGSTVRARLFNRDLVPQGAPFELDGLEIALSATGGLLEVHTHKEATDEWFPIGRLHQVRHEADACVRRGDLFLCDTGNDGFDAEAGIAFGDGAVEEAPFLADWDGDGRADPCLYRNGKFFCDTGHDGGTGVSSPTVGTAGDVPLLGDLNGDGKADPCVRSGATVLCDLARKGGARDLRITFGVAGEKVLLGDPDGDGRDDPCLLRDGRLLCDTVHDGNFAELQLDLQPLDVEGPTLFGDVNGDGRDEACRFAGDRFVCGVYPASGGAPAETIEIVFGQPGDVPLLGDLDAF